VTNKLRDPSSDEDVASVLDGVGLGRVEDVGVMAESEQDRGVEDLLGVRKQVRRREEALYSSAESAVPSPAPAAQQKQDRTPGSRTYTSQQFE